MRRLLSILLILLLLVGCGRQVITSSAPGEMNVASPTATILLSAEPTKGQASPAPTSTPRPPLPTCAPRDMAVALFPEDLLSKEADPIRTLVQFLLTAEDLPKSAFAKQFAELIRSVETLDKYILLLSDKGRTLTADRKEKTCCALLELMSDDTIDALLTAYSRCPGEGGALPVLQYAEAMDALRLDIQGLEDRTIPFYGLGPDVAREYITAVSQHMGEPVSPNDIFYALEELMQAEAYAISAALQADPEADRKKEPISMGGFTQNLSFLRRVSQELCPLPNGAVLPMPKGNEAEGDMNLFELAYRYYPGIAFLRVYAAQVPAEQQARWVNAPDGYLQGLAIHNSYAVIPYIDGFETDYLQYQWYKEMLDTTMTGMTALLIHYYGYSEKDLAEYLEAWGAESFTGYLYEKAMSDPFDSLVAAYGYYRYLDVCQAALDAGCESEEQFLRDYLAVGPAPFRELKEYMVSLYQKQG